MTKRKNRFTTGDNPPAVFFDRKPLPVQGIRAAVLAKLVTDPVVEMADLLALGVSSAASVYVHISEIRKILPPGVALAKRYGCGYRLQIPRGG